MLGTSLVVQRLRFHAPHAGRPGSTSGPRTGSHMLQLKSLHASMKTEDPACHNEDLVQSNKHIHVCVKQCFAALEITSVNFLVPG